MEIARQSFLPLKRVHVRVSVRGRGRNSVLIFLHIHPGSTVRIKVRINCLAVHNGEKHTFSSNLVGAPHRQVWAVHKTSTETRQSYIWALTARYGSTWKQQENKKNNPSSLTQREEARVGNRQRLIIFRGAMEPPNREWCVPVRVGSRHTVSACEKVEQTTQGKGFSTQE